MTEEETWQEYDEYSFLIKAKSSNDFVWNAIFTKYDCTDMAKDFYRQAVKALNNPYDVIDEVKFISSIENKRAYVLKFKDGEIYTYNFVPKKQKSKDCHISVLYMTDKDLSGANLNKIVDSSLNEAESFLK